MTKLLLGTLVACLFAVTGMVAYQTIAGPLDVSQSETDSPCRAKKACCPSAHDEVMSNGCQQGEECCEAKGEKSGCCAQGAARAAALTPADTPNTSDAPKKDGATPNPSR